MVKSGTPDAIIDRLNDAINKALAKASVREAFAKIAAEPAGGTPAEFGAHQVADRALEQNRAGRGDQDPRVIAGRNGMREGDPGVKACHEFDTSSFVEAFMSWKHA